MLKALKPDTYAGIANAKCGEVYFQSLTSYRINCAFCDIKSFVFGDFLLHIQNVHFENGLLKTEVPMPKLERRESQTSPPAAAAQANQFPWYDMGDDGVNNDEMAADDSEDDEADLATENNDEDPVGMASNTIMKWDSARGGGAESTSTLTATRNTRSHKVRYNEDLDNDSAAEGVHDGADSDSKDVSPSKKSQLACEHCGKIYQSTKTLRRHVERQHKFDESDDDADYEPPKAAAPKAPLEYKCEHCDKVYQGKYTLRQHVKRDHDEGLGGVFACLECEVELPRLRLLDEHVLEVHGGAPCTVCGRRYRTRHELKRHYLKHTNERNVLCEHPGCGKRFFTTRHMRNHIKVHSEEKNFVCENCGYSCRNKETLRVHIRSHTGERPFACKVCDKCFPSHSGLREHMAMHSTDRPHVCNVCGATFSRQKGLYHHKFLHAATKQFVCKLCGNAYAQAAGLAGHMRKHRNDELNG